MPRPEYTRRTVMLGAGASWGVGPLAALAGFAPDAVAEPDPSPTAEPFDSGHVIELAEALAAAEFVKPHREVAEAFAKLTAEQFRDIRYRSEQTLWRGENLDCELQLYPMGWIYDAPVEIWLVEGGKARALKADGSLFGFGSLIEKAPNDAPYGFSGFRLLGPINRAEQYEEFAQFQGASYFRGIGRGQHFGMSARGLAVDTAQPAGEEFPIFRSFWIEKPLAGSGKVIVHALLDSRSVAGAYRFTIDPGESTSVEVEATLFLRRKLTHIGIAPLTSMYLHGTASRRVNGDVRPAVHDSEGLAVLNGKGERLWRPLRNPMKLQTSAFVDKDPKGFGLCQRDRSFAQFEDLEARYERRPTVWVEPIGAWGEGYVELIEIPAEEQIHDNIVALWKPAKGLEPGKPHIFAYRLTWAGDVPVAWTGAKVRKTRVGKVRRDKEELEQFVIDFDGPGLKDINELPRAELSVSSGVVSNLAVERNPEIAGVRTSFELNAGGAEMVELRLGLKLNEQAISESWLFRWTKT